MENNSAGRARPGELSTKHEIYVAAFGGHLFYCPQQSWGKVIFSRVSVILLTGGVSAPRGGLLWGGCLLPGGCLLGGVSAPGGVCSRGVSAPGWCAWWRSPRIATAAGGTHPTGMHSCYDLFLQGLGGIAPSAPPPLHPLLPGLSKI